MELFTDVISFDCWVDRLGSTTSLFLHCTKEVNQELISSPFIQNLVLFWKEV